MKRKEFLKTFCGVGMCTCAAPFAFSSENTEISEKSSELKRLEWWNAHTKKQWAKLWEIMNDYLDQEKQNEIIEQLGRNCFMNIPWLHNYKGDPEGYFKEMNQRYGENFNYDKENNIIMIETPERDCVCQLVDSSITPHVFCNCSIGWQKQAYEMILGKSVNVELLESVLQGSKRCIFRVSIL